LSRVYKENRIMECSLVAFVACFSWSNLFIDSGLIYQDSGVERSETVTRPITIDIGRVEHSIESVTYRQWNDRRNPYGSVAVGYELQFGSISWSLELRHTSSLHTGSDRGINSAMLGMRWRPFAR
jgi:hypothetical protein